jgi:hypothetical protein
MTPRDWENLGREFPRETKLPVTKGKAWTKGLQPPSTFRAPTLPSVEIPRVNPFPLAQSQPAKHEAQDRSGT